MGEGEPAMTATAKRQNKRASSGPAPDVMGLADAAKFLRLPAKTIVRLVKEQGLPGRQIGKEWRFLRAAIERWLEPAKAQGGSVLDQFGILANDPDYDEYRKTLERIRKEWNEEVA
jgi:excisionase family DNA binding protein